jgi:hypothetical protein
MDKNKSLLDLPVLPESRDSGDTDNIVSTYLHGLKKVSSPEELKEFVSYWKNIYLLKDDSELIAAEIALVELDFDAVVIFPLFSLKGDEGLDFDAFNNQVMANIAAPKALIKASLLAHKYGVGHDLAMVRLYLDPFPEFNDKLR